MVHYSLKEEEEKKKQKREREGVETGEFNEIETTTGKIKEKLVKKKPMNQS